MASSIVDISRLDIDSRLNNLEARSRCGTTPVCPGMLVPSLCSDRLSSANSRCLVPYHYPMTVSEVAAVAQEANYAERLKEAEEASASAFATEEGKKEVSPPFQPDWRFWTGVSLSGLGLFFFRSR